MCIVFLSRIKPFICRPSLKELVCQTVEFAKYEFLRISSFCTDAFLKLETAVTRKEKT